LKPFWPAVPGKPATTIIIITIPWAYTSGQIGDGGAHAIWSRKNYFRNTQGKWEIKPTS